MDLGEYSSIYHKKYNTYDLSGEYGIGYTNNGKEFYFDLEDYSLIKDIRWNVKKEGYVCGWVNKDIQRVQMHHWITGIKNIDHINRNPNDNRRCNLRESTLYENARNKSITHRNKSGVIGVYWNTNKQRWVAVIRMHGKKIFDRYFINKEDAIIARLNAEVTYFGEFAPQRHLYDQYGVKERQEDN